MNGPASTELFSAEEKLCGLIKTLHETVGQIEELTAAEVDSGADQAGRTFLLRRAQEELQHSVEAKQAAILNALPAHIALLNAEGQIISVNDAWRRFADTNGLISPSHGLGANYLHVCDFAKGNDSEEARDAAALIRSVLSGATKGHTLEYPCHSPTEQRWFLLSATPLAGNPPDGAVVMHTNITARKLAEQALVELTRSTAQRERLLSTTLSSLHDFAFVFDRAGRFLFANEPLLNTFGLALDKVVGKNFHELGYPDHLAQRLQSQVQLVFDTRETVTDATPFVSAAGVEGVYEYIFSPGPVIDGSLEFVAGSSRDVTDRTRAEEKVRLSQKQLRDMIDGLGPDIFVGLLTPHGVLLEVNRSTLEAAGLQAVDVLGKPFADTHWWSDSEQAREQIRAAIVRGANGNASRFEVRALGADGRHIDVDLSLQPLRDETGRVTFLVLSASVITERKMAEESLRASEATFRTLTEAMPQMVWTARADGWLTYFNQQWTDYSGLSFEESRGYGSRQAFHPDDKQRAWEEWQNAVSTVDTYSTECRFRRKDGVYRWWLVRGVPVKNDNGIVDKWFGTCTDIHEMKLLEQAVSRSNEALRENDLNIKRLNRVYSVLSQINSLIVRITNRDELFGEACRIAVEDGGFRMALISIVDRSTMNFITVASSGKNDTLMAAVKALLRSADVQKSMIVRAVASSTAMVSNDLQHDPAILLGAKFYEAGIRSLAVFPLIVSSEAVGMLALYADEIDFFHAAELKLLTELTADISFAMDYLSKQERLHYLAYYDALTGLANRSLFLERVEQHLQRAAVAKTRLGIGVIDLERFKSINDSLGQASGDALLKQVAQWLSDNLGGAEFLARIDADHFAVVLPEIRHGSSLLRHVESKMAAFTEHSFILNGAPFRISYKVGIARFPDDGDNAQYLFNNAEAALKIAKAGGERYLLFTQKMTATVAARLRLENKLRQAIERKEFVLHYQPKVCLASGLVSGAEALIRWNDPLTGLVPPGRFIPVLEETGLIHEVGRWALRQAIADYLGWRAAGLPAVRIAVNVSPLQLRNRNFVGEIHDAVVGNPCAAQGLELEITESVIMADAGHSTTTLRAIRAMGISVAIDDFGTGFSSLNYLSKLPVDTLKIDRSFVIDMNTTPEGLALVSTIVNMAHSLKLKVVAEGVETEEQAQTLRLLKCEEMQGFLFSKPLPREVFEARFLMPHTVRA
jgi:diguanylate cyclase (GGDEF)-like protein/PAS domain S-box-containing protein